AGDDRDARPPPCRRDRPRARSRGLARPARGRRRGRAEGGADVSGMNFFFFHLMPWPYLPPPREFLREHEAAWVTLSNAEYEPVKGMALYERYLDELVHAEEIGLDGVVVNEHHQNAYGIMPSPNLIAAALSQRTERVKICVLGNALPLWNPPVRVAEE